jgi:hypothetical protein
MRPNWTNICHSSIQAVRLHNIPLLLKQRLAIRLSMQCMPGLQNFLHLIKTALKQMPNKMSVSQKITKVTKVYIIAMENINKYPHMTTALVSTNCIPHIRVIVWQTIHLMVQAFYSGLTVEIIFFFSQN